MKQRLINQIITAFLLIFPRLGPASPDEKYVIGSLPVEGLFSSFLGVLANIMWVDKNHQVPVVYWTERCFYAQKEGYNGSFNPWEYYFEPVSHLAYESGDIVHKHFFDPTGFSIYESFRKNPDHFESTLRLAANETIDKYIRVKPNILEKVHAYYEQNMRGKTTIGIHLRGTDKVGGEKKLELRQLIVDAANRSASEASGAVQFYIATDEIALLDFAKAHLQGTVISRDSHRSEGTKPVHRTREDGTWSKALLGEEVLIDMLLLSKCDFLVHSLSCVSITALLFNPQLPHEYILPPQKQPDKLSPHLRRKKEMRKKKDGSSSSESHCLKF